MTTRTKRTAGLVAVATMAILALTACLNVTYNLTVNSDATVSGSLQAGIAKEVMKSLGVTSKEQLDQAIVSGKLDTGVNGNVAQKCAVSDNATDWIITCTVAQAQVTDINKTWSLTKADGNLTLHVVSDSPADAAEAQMSPDMKMGTLSFTATFPGPISSITGNGATKVDDNTFTIAGSLGDSFDVTVVAASEPPSSTKTIVIIVVAALIVLAILTVIVFAVRRRKTDDVIVEVVDETTPTADSSDPSI
jgi:hypothetical protein